MKDTLENKSTRVKCYPFLCLAGTLVALLVVANNASAETLQQYAAKCDAAVAAGTPFTSAQVTVPAFNCDAGTEVPTTDFGGPLMNPNDGLCDRPNVLNRACDPGSRFQVLRRDPYVVAHCRKQGLANGHYGDIAVIQWNEDNGATCFYQALGDMDGRLVAAPSKGEGPWSPTATPASHWFSPAITAGTDCGGCHDNGAIIRSPYLTQITGPNELPGRGDITFNRDQPYHFVGEDFASWHAYKVHVQGNICVNCHRMGTNNVINSGGTALDFGLRATAASQRSKNPHSATSPIWMLPGQIIFQQSSADAAAAIAACAARKNENPLPNEPGCTITPLSTSDTPSSPAGSLQFSAADYSVNEDAGSAVITVTRTGGSSGQVSANFTTGGGTAIDGADYTFTNGVLTWTDGDAADKTFSVPIIDDGDIEGAETVNLTLSSPNGGATLGAPNPATLTIAASDTVAATCNGLPAQAGTAGADNFPGTPGNDVYNGLGGNDIISGSGGVDTLCGGIGDDKLSGGSDKDFVNGGVGIDTVRFFDSNVSVTANLATGTAVGQGRDTLVGIENVGGSNFADTLTGSGGPNVLSGNGGNDHVNGAAGNDLISGGIGNDAMNGGTGADTCNGGPGVDTRVACEAGTGAP